MPVAFCRSISAFPTVAAYNNKAQAEIKLQNWHVALQDCETVLRMDPENVKGKIQLYLLKLSDDANHLKSTEPIQYQCQNTPD